jgi:hypothetical protein
LYDAGVSEGTAAGRVSRRVTTEEF